MTNTYNTGNALGSTDPRDLLDNASNLDDGMNSTLPTFTDRLGVSRDTWAGQEAAFDLSQVGREAEFQAFLVSSGFISLGNYAGGISVTAYNEYVAFGGFFYRPAASSIPFVTSGTWVGDDENKFVLLSPDDVLRQDLADDLDPAKGAGLVGFIAAVGAASRTVYSKLLDFVTRTDYLSDAAFNAAKVGKLSRDALGRLRDASFIAGTEELAGATTRDAFVTGRTLSGSTDCHAFADRTVIANATDSGTYGTFDSTTEIAGTHNQSHQFSFQDRAKFTGTGTLGTWGNIIWPEMNGPGTVSDRTDIEIKDVSGTGGAITSHIGLYIRNLARASSNVAINVAQTTGYSYFAPGEGQLYSQGDAGFGVTPLAGTPIVWRHSGTGNGFASYDDTNGNIIGVAGDKKNQLFTNGAARLVCRESGFGYQVTPGADNTQSLGGASFRWSVVYAVTGTINTSDAREKTDVRSLSTKEIAAAIQLSKDIGVYQWLAAVEAKGSDAREHIGMTVQHAIEVMEQHGLSPFSYGFICHDEFDEGGRYGFRFDQLLAFIAAGISARLEALEERA